MQRKPAVEIFRLTKSRVYRSGLAEIENTHVLVSFSILVSIAPFAIVSTQLV